MLALAYHPAQNLIRRFVLTRVFSQLTSEVKVVEEQEYDVLQSENERLLSEVVKLKQRLRE